VKGPTEKRIEADFFKPSLSKQRLEYVVKHIKESSASTLVGSLCFLINHFVFLLIVIPSSFWEFFVNTSATILVAG